AQYVTGLANVLATQQANPALRHVFFLSSTRVFGYDAGEWLDESASVKPGDFGGERLLEAERLLAGLACSSTALRLSGIYGPGRLRMIRLATSQAWPQQNSWSNRIHCDDAAAFTVYLLEQVLAGKPILPCYIVSDDAPATLYEVLAWLTGQLQLSMPQHEQQALTGKRLCNRLMRSTGYRLMYPNFQLGYRALLDSLATG
nr:SDR family NAD(P)-dependent oxidoreductase [Methylotenera sp.]